MSKANFSEVVKQIVKNIPRGEVRTYKQIAESAGSPQSARAVARVMTRNYNPEIPCHRVIRSDGTLGGYNRGGEARKRAILKSERATLVT